MPIFTFCLIDNDFLTTKLYMEITSPAVPEVLVDTYSAILICIHKGLKDDMSPHLMWEVHRGGRLSLVMLRSKLQG